MRFVEVAKYLGVGYRELAEAPGWFYEIALIRMVEEMEYHAYVARQNQHK